MRRLAAAALAAALVAACSSGDDGGTPAIDRRATTTTSPAPTTTTAKPGPPAPLTGLPTPSEDAAARPAVTVKVDNSNQGRPQAGLGDADIVIEEKVEGSVTRLLAVFHSRDAKLVGPIRSVRSTDPPIVAPIGGVFAYSDGIPSFVSRAKAVGVQTVSELRQGAAFVLRAGRYRPYKTFAATATLRQYASKTAGPPPALFYFADEGEMAGGPTGTPATKATTVFGSRTSAIWTWDAVAERWQRTSNGTPHLLEGGGRLGFANVIVQRVSYRLTGKRDRSRSVVEEAVVTGTGDALILVAGRQVSARWSKPSTASVTRYTDRAGAPIKLSPGPTCVQLLPTRAALTVG